MNNIRNFCIISHIDAGKSTLADRFLELTKTVSKEKMRPQYLDMMDLERERGITIKMQPVRMLYEHPQNQKSKIKNQKENKEFYILNLIDTPGHVDFSYEVSRSLAAVEGAILLVDATKGIQAQTIGNLELVRKQNLVIIPVINKIDLLAPHRAEGSGAGAQAKIRETKSELASLLNVPQEEIFEISAKYGTNVEELLKAVIEKIPPPKGDLEKPFRALIFDSKYDSFKGVVAFVRIVDGKIQTNEKIYLMAGRTEGEIRELGYFTPDFSAQKELKIGEIGYLATGIKEPAKVRVGDTIIKIQNSKFKIQNSEVKPLPGYHESKSMVFISLYPENPDDFESLNKALEKLKLNDPALTFKQELKEGLGRGFQCGFLGLLHAEIITERLKREFNLNLILSTPSVIYKVLTSDNQEIIVYTPSDWPNSTKIKETKELWAKVRVLIPLDYLGQILKLLENFEGEQIKTHYFGIKKIELVYEIPFRELIQKNLYDKLKTVSQGFASMDYQILDWRPSNLVKLEILIFGKKEEAFSQIVPEKKAYQEGKKLVERLKELLPAQLFSVPLQAVVSGRIIARETIRARGKDVIAPLYGGDYTRKRKLLERQKRGKKELREKGEIHIPQNIFFKL